MHRSSLLYRDCLFLKLENVPKMLSRAQHGLSPSGNLINMHKIAKLASVGFNSQLQNSTKILIFSNCACVKPFQHKSEFGNILTLKTQNFFFAGVEYSSKAF